MIAFSDALHSQIAHLPTVTLASIDGVSLLSRFDTKYVLHESQLLALLEAVAHTYQILEIADQRIGRYTSVYFDTADFAMYASHHSGARTRYKVRCRSYEDSGVVYLEMKEKTNKERTTKQRIPLAMQIDAITAIDPAWLPGCLPYPVDQLQPVLWNRFRRLTLVNLSQSERITVDIGLSFGANGVTLRREGLVVAEIKQPRRSAASRFAQEMHRQRVYPTSFSKYCMAAATLYPALKYNRFKPLFLRLDRICPLRKAQ